MAVDTDDYVSTRLSQLKVGAALRQPIYDAQSQRRQLLLAAGCVLSESQLRALRRRGITSVFVHRTEFVRITGNHHAPAASSAAPRPLPPAPPAENVAPPPDAASGGWKNEADSFINSVQPPKLLLRNLARAAQFARTYDQAVESTSVVVDVLVKYKELNARRVNDLSQQHLAQIAVDLDEFLMCGLQPVRSDYPSRHCLQTAMLACSIGTTMGLRRDELMELGFGCLLHDAGMLLVPRAILEATGALTVAQRLEVQKHPMHAANLLNHCRDVPQGARHIVYQMHERMNGSGYPRQRSGNQIHLLARIAAVADTHLALVSPRPFRPALEPYQAIEKLLFSTRQGLFDPSVVRALIHTVSLFPIGSGVLLNDGRRGRVIRGNRDQFARPVIEIVDSNPPWPVTDVINLSETPELTVVSTTELPEPVTEDAELVGSA
ncbi:MAG TPA: HD domain-containing phosphohydrolase [Planctomycetaceae bacterium]|nr:HD domain-containing phosphohydrolase [Planctomycetaceae bacterium]